jgi:hypothetical protein
VAALQLAGCRCRGLGIAEHDLGRDVERAHEPAPGMALVVGVLLDARGHQRVGDLEQQRSPSPGQ